MQRLAKYWVLFLPVTLTLPCHVFVFVYYLLDPCFVFFTPPLIWFPQHQHNTLSCTLFHRGVLSLSDHHRQLFFVFHASFPFIAFVTSSSFLCENLLLLLISITCTNNNARLWVIVPIVLQRIVISVYYFVKFTILTFGHIRANKVGKQES